MDMLERKPENKIIGMEDVPPDMSLVLSMISHIEKPCEDGKGNTARKHHLILVRSLLPKITNPLAKKMLQDTISKYE